ncbi:MAG: hypothetical protein ACI9CF_002052 [Candidatus Omnitrophota bacterium]|jgi:hypothetical protein
METVLLLAAYFVASSLFGGILALRLIATDDNSRDVTAMEHRQTVEALRRALKKEADLSEALGIKMKELDAVRQIAEYERRRYEEATISLKTQVSHLQTHEHDVIDTDASHLVEDSSKAIH